MTLGSRRWPEPLVICPEDIDPEEQHGYVLNGHLPEHEITYSSGSLAGRSRSDVIVIGEKYAGETDYWMSAGEFDRVVEPYKHGVSSESNYLFLDLHVDLRRKPEAYNGVDPWDPVTALP